MADPKIDIKQVEHVARLARLRLEGHEVAEFSEQLGAILAYMEALEQVDVRGVEPTFHPATVKAVLREDRAKPCLPREEALAAAPKQDAGGFAVPKVLDGD